MALPEEKWSVQPSSCQPGFQATGGGGGNTAPVVVQKVLSPLQRSAVTPTGHVPGMEGRPAIPSGGASSEPGSVQLAQGESSAAGASSAVWTWAQASF